MLSFSCPRCGEKDELRGTYVDSEIEVTCLSCGSTSPREAPTCRTCGRTDVVHGSQRMTRYARGLLVAVVGMRDVLLCRVCDDEVASAVATRSELVPEGYVSRFLFGDVPEAPPVQPKPTSAPQRKPRATSSAPSAPSAPSRPAPVRSTKTDDRRLIQDPTVRQAIEVFLTDSAGPQDSLCLVLLGAELGPSTRVSQLDDAHQKRLTEWVADKFGGARTPRRRVAVSTIVELIDYWRDHGWISSDLAAGLR